DADIAGGDGELYDDLCPSPDRYCRVPDGQFEYARQTYFLGRPKHDGAEFDRVAAGAVLPPGFQPESYSIENLDTEARIVIPSDGAQTDVNRGPLAPGARISSGGQVVTLTPTRVLAPPCTLRLRLRVDNTAAPAGQRIRLGPIDYIHYPLASNDVFDPDGYGSFQCFEVRADPSNTTKAFLTDLDESGAGYWNGAYCLFVSGANAGRALKVTGYDAATGRLTLETNLPNMPQAGDVGVVGHWARLQGVDAAGRLLPWQNLNVILSETHGSSDDYFPEVAFVYVADNSYDSPEIYVGRYHPNYVTFDRGRTVVMEGLAWAATGSTWPSALYGRPAGAGSPQQFSATIRLQKVEFSGPWQYQVLRADGEQGPSLADNFMVWLSVPGEQGLQPQVRSVKVWRQRGVQLGKQRPTKWPVPSETEADLRSAPWRSQDCSSPWPVEERGDEVLASVVGTDASAVRRIGYVLGRWNSQTGRIDWTDEPPPPGKSNPFFEGPPLSVDRADDTPAIYALGGCVLPTPDGKWMLVFGAKMSDPDHSQCGLLLAGEDRWSFDRERTWWRDNPLLGVNGAVDVPFLTGGGTGTWANRDASYGIVYDAHTEYPARRYLGYARGKSHVFGYVEKFHDIRPLIGVRSSDGRVWSPLPDGRQIQPLCAPEFHVGGFMVADDGTVLVSPSKGLLWVSEDGVHFQQLFGQYEFLPGQELPGEARDLFAITRFRLGDRTVYYCSTGSGVN
ncbi:MAG: hypothetical protein H5T86_13665, partial [Armatimonadetes bacterium]|nr:hypothetical protein [Armatimonadota bacterium]